MVKHLAPISGLTRLAACAIIAILPMASVAETEDSPFIGVADTMYDAGLIQQGRLLEHAFLLRNTSMDTIVLGPMIPDCRCTKAEASATVIPPGEIMEIKAIYDPEFRLGRFSSSVKVTFLKPPKCFLSLRLRAVVGVDYSLSPPARVLSFGQVVVGEDKAISTRIVSNDRSGIEVTQCISTWPAISIDVTQAAPDTVNLRLLLAGCREEMMLSEFLVIQFRGISEALRIPVQAKVNKDVQASPYLLDFGTVAKSEKKSLPLVIKTFGGAVVTSVTAATDTGDSSCIFIVRRGAVEDQNTYDVSVQNRDAAQPGLLHDEIVISSTSKYYPLVRVPILGRLGYK